MHVGKVSINLGDMCTYRSTPFGNHTEDPLAPAPILKPKP